MKSPRDLDLDPTLVRRGTQTYFCSDAALFTGMAVVVAGLSIGVIVYFYFYRAT